MKKLLVLLLAAAACSDPCAALGKEFLLQGTRFPEEVDMTWSGADAGSYEVWAFGPLHEDLYKNPIATVPENGVVIVLDADAGTVVFESRPVIEGKACPTSASALIVPLEPQLTATPQVDGVLLSWQSDALYGASAQIARGPDDSDLHTLASADGGTYLDGTAERGTSYVYAIEMQSKNLIALSAPVTTQTLPP